MATQRIARRASPLSSLHGVEAINGEDGAVWHKSAPEAVRRAFSAGDPLGGWAAWKRHLARRKAPVDPAEFLPGNSSPLGWALPDGLDSPPAPAWLAGAERLLADRRPPEAAVDKELLGWLGFPSGGDRNDHPPNVLAGSASDPAYALEVLAPAYAIARLSAALSPEVWWALLDHLLSTVSDAAIELENDPLVHQLLAGELALTLAYLLPELVPCRKLQRTSRRALSRGPLDLLDGEGLPHAKHLALMRPLLACWTRCRALGELLKGGCWTASAETQYEWLVRQTLRMARHDGTHVFSNGSAEGFSPAMFQAALHFGGDGKDRKIAALVLPGNHQPGNTAILARALPQPALHSEWAATAVLRPAWSRSGERLTVVYPGRSVRMELGCGEEVLWSGVWQLEVCIDGNPAAPISDWEQLCWISDEEVDFLELEIELDRRLRVQRQMALARQDGFLLLADAVLCDAIPAAPSNQQGPGKLEYRGCLSLCPGITFRGEDETREGLLVGRKGRALVLPLALPEWRSERRIGELTQSRQGLELRQSSTRHRLYAPLFFDLCRPRQTSRRTWRQLTVAESLAIQPADVAVGYRVAVGKQQWLIYRSLAEKANRTLLGHNLSTEMLLARFDRSGEVEPLLEIE